MRTLAGFALLATLALGGCKSAEVAHAEPCPSCKAPRSEPDGTCDACGAIITVVADTRSIDEGF
jgi:hypothetical protein